MIQHHFTAPQSAGAARGLASARDDVERAIGQNLPDPLWDWLLREEHVEDYTLGRGKLRELVHHARSGLELVRQAQRPVPRLPRKAARATASARSRAIAELDAARAARVQSVHGGTAEDFRSAYTGGRLLRAEEILEWIEYQYHEDGGETNWLRVRVPHRGWKQNPRTVAGGGGFVPTEPITVGEGAQHADGVDFLTMTVPDPVTGLTEIYLAVGGTLDELRLLAGRIAREVGWTEWEAVGFVLTGAAPVVPLVDTETRSGGRIALAVHPSATPRELATAYAAIRRERGLTGRNLSEKHIALAAFIAANPNEGVTWPRRMRAWNESLSKERKDWRYTDADHFSRDVNQARRRMEERNGKARGG